MSPLKEKELIPVTAVTDHEEHKKLWESAVHDRPKLTKEAAAQNTLGKINIVINKIPENRDIIYHQISEDNRCNKVLWGFI